MPATTVFARDDDLGQPFAALARFNSLFIDRDIPIAYQVVPAFLDDETAAEARAMRQARPDLVELHQHGNSHTQILNGEPTWSEFAGSVPFEEQARVLAAGRARLEEMLGEDFDPRVFTPPEHKYGPDTLRALELLHVETLSCGVRTDATARAVYRVGRLAGKVRVRGKTISHHGRHLPGSPIREWSCAVNVDMDSNGDRVTRSSDELSEMFSAARAELDVVGVMFHHQCYVDDAKFEVAARFLDRLAADPSVQFARLGSLSAR